MTWMNVEIIDFIKKNIYNSNTTWNGIIILMLYKYLLFNR